jgi:hypothetical protein
MEIQFLCHDMKLQMGQPQPHTFQQCWSPKGRPARNNAVLKAKQAWCDFSFLYEMMELRELRERTHHP